MNATCRKQRNCQGNIVNCRWQVGNLQLLIAAATLLAFVGVVMFAAPAAAQFRVAPGLRAMAAPAAPPGRARAADDAADEMKDLAERKFPGGAALKTDPEQQRLLKRAEQCVADGRLDLAAVLWQRVLDEAGDTLMTRDGTIYFSLADEVERTLSAADPRALATYRIQADGEAQAVLAKAGPDREEEALATVVRKYFLSSVGDEAAYKLACYALDRHDFIGASRLLTRILERYPDPSMPKTEILLRLAIASAHIGDAATANTALDAIGQIPGPRPESDILDQVAQHLKLASQSSALATAGSQGWSMMLGNASRTGRMKSLPQATTTKTLSELWVHEDDMEVSQSNTPNPYGMMGGMVFVHRTGRMVPQQQNRAQAVSHDDLVEQWRERKWTPTGMLLFDGGRVYIKTHEDLQCYSTEVTSGRLLWKSLWQNRYALDGMSAQLEAMFRAYGYRLPVTGDRPSGLAEIHLFGDRVHQQMSMAGGLIYSIEGERFTPGSSGKQESARQPAWGVQPRRTRSNFLAAYETRSGKVKWHRAASDEDKENSQDVGFLCAPVPFGDLLLTAVTDGGTIWLYGLNASDGTTAWKAYLCDEPQHECKPWSPIGIAVEGQEAYVCCGTGVVFAVDAASGTIRWAVRYQRAEKGPNQQLQNYYGVQQRRSVAGWDDDVVIPMGRVLVVLPSDSDQILALDRRTGKELFPLPRAPSGMQEASYCLGVSGKALFVAGRNVVRRWDIPSGKLVWDCEIGESFGRGCLTDDAIYVPVRDSIVKLDLEKGRELSQVGVALTTGDPVGNLFSDGDKLWVTGAGRVYAMTNLAHRLELLADKIAAGDAEAQLDRMRLYAKAKETEAMLADLRGAYALLQKSQSPDDAAEKFLAAISELRLPQDAPNTVLALLAEHYVDAPSIPKLERAARRRADLLANTLGTVRQRKLKGLVRPILKLAPLYDTDYLAALASQALLTTAKMPDDAAALEESVAGDNPLAQLVATLPLSRLLKADAKEPLTKLVSSSDDRVKLAAARGLADLGDRSMLPVFVSLLKSENARVRQASHETLRALTRQPIAFASQGPPDVRARTVARWEEWVNKEGGNATLKTPLPDLALRLGRTLVASQIQSSVVELDAEFKAVSTIRVPNPWGVWGLPNGHKLVAAYAERRVVEYDDAGKEIWSKDNLPGPPYSVQRLDNGSTLVACADVNQILEIAPDGTSKNITGPWGRTARPVFARRLENGRTLVALQQERRVVELDESGKYALVFDGVEGPSSCVRLDNGNTLIVEVYAGRVSEFDSQGNRTDWSVKFRLQNPTDAQRLDNGNTLIADAVGLHEVDPSGNRIRDFSFPNAVSVSSY